ncbi:MAG: hypothetical protein U5N56_01125 [Candidatus Marinimicrobia bacterium]|nr:hypothetical protein [Candidatus Neomarinimicrobiota bacterium]
MAYYNIIPHWPFRSGFGNLKLTMARMYMNVIIITDITLIRVTGIATPPRPHAIPAMAEWVYADGGVQTPGWQAFMKNTE